MDIDLKKFKEISGFNGRCAIDEDGNVLSLYRFANRFRRRIDKPLLMRAVICNNGYKGVNLFDPSGKKKRYQIHRLVAITFLDNPENKKCVCHKDNNKLNCNVNNLYWGTFAENSQQAYADGRMPQPVPVAQIDSENNIVGIYKSQTEAAKALGIISSYISACLSNPKRHRTGGYAWKRLTQKEYEELCTHEGKNHG